MAAPCPPKKKKKKNFPVGGFFFLSQQFAEGEHKNIPVLGMENKTRDKGLLLPQAHTIPTALMIP